MGNALKKEGIGMKKIASILLAVLMLFSMFVVTSSAAYDKVTVNVSKTEANVGDVIKVTVSVAANSNLVAFTGKATYDTSCFQLVDGSAVGGSVMDGQVNTNTAGVVIYAGATGGKVTTAGTLVSFELKVLKTGGTIKFSVSEAYVDDNGNDKDVTSEIGGASITIKAPSCSHKNTQTDKKDPTCMADGYETVTCKDCGKQISKKVLSASGVQHKMGDYKVVTDSTCSKEGKKEATCSVCGYKDTQTIAKKAHTYGAFTVTKEATCNAEGTKTATCSVCKETKTEKIAKTSHNFGAYTVTKEATCTSEGLKTRTCSICKEVQKEIIVKTSHDFDTTKEKVTKEPTCTETGTKQVWCKTCSKYIDRGDVIPAKGHEFEEGSERIEPTCTEDGKEIGKCKNCGEDGAEIIIPATGHTYGDWVETVKPTTKQEGEKERECSTCGEKETEKVAKLNKKPVETEEDEEEEEFPLVLVLCIGGGVAALAGLALVVVMILRKKKTNA